MKHNVIFLGSAIALFAGCTKWEDLQSVRSCCPVVTSENAKIRFELKERIVLEQTNQSFIGWGMDLIYNDSQYFIPDKFRNTILVFDWNGKFVRRVGRPGEGPGEFLQLIKAQANSNYIVGQCMSRASLHIFKRNGEYLKSLTYKDYKVEPDPYGFGLYNDYIYFSGNSFESKAYRSRPEYFSNQNQVWKYFISNSKMLSLDIPGHSVYQYLPYLNPHMLVTVNNSGQVFLCQLEMPYIIAVHNKAKEKFSINSPNFVYDIGKKRNELHYSMILDLKAFSENDKSIILIYHSVQNAKKGDPNWKKKDPPKFLSFYKKNGEPLLLDLNIAAFRRRWNLQSCYAYHFSTDLKTFHVYSPPRSKNKSDEAYIYRFRVYLDD